MSALAAVADTGILAMSRVRELARPLLVRIMRTLTLFAYRVGVTVGPALRTAGRHIAAAVDRVESILVPALIAAGAATVRAVQRAEEWIVPGLRSLSSRALRLVDRTEQAAVPALRTAGTRSVDATSRGQGAVAAGITATGRTLLGGVSRFQARTVPGVAEPAAAPIGGVAVQEGEPVDTVITSPLPPDDEDEYVPPPSQIEPPQPRELVLRARVRAAVGSVSGMLATAGVVIVAVALVADMTVGTAVRDGAQAVGVNLVLPEDATLKDLNERSYIYAANGQELDVLDREENRRIVDLEQIPEHVRLAVIAAEDKRFYEHDGYDIEGIGRALVANVEAGDITQGGSTITQQLAKSAVGTERSYTRKLEELAYAVALENKFSKDELLEQYLNQVFFGEASYGVAAAAEEYFGVTDVTTLTVEQGALLAAMIRSPNNANPRSDPATAKRRRDATLDVMVEQGFLDPGVAQLAKAQAVVVVPNTPRARPYDFIADSVRREFVSQPEFAQFGATQEERERHLWFGGLRIHTSLDPRLQEIAKDVIAQRYPGTDPLQPTGAIVSVEPASGRIMAAHSGLDYGVEQLAIPTQARRQPGSAAKPFVYAEALQQGFPPNIALSGRSPACYPEIPGWGCRGRNNDGVSNYGNTSYRGPLDMASALRNSVNTAAVQLSLVVGTDRVLDLMGRMGINTVAATTAPGTTEQKITPALALGGFENGVTPLEMASAYAVFANNGISVKPHFIDRIEDREGNILYAAQPQGQQVLDPAVNAMMVRMMQGVVTGGTGTRARIPGWPVAGKTGTTQRNVDAWFVGYTPTMSTAVWTGVPARSTPMGSITGGAARGPIVPWQQFMARALEGVPPVPFPEVATPQGRLVPGEPVTVPNVMGRSSTDALRELGNAKLFGQTRETPSRQPAGTVIGQSPRGGTTATVGDTIVLNVSTGRPAQPSPAPAPQAPAPLEPDPYQPEGRGGDDPGRGDEDTAAAGGGRFSPGSPGGDPPVEAPPGQGGFNVLSGGRGGDPSPARSP